MYELGVLSIVLEDCSFLTPMVGWQYRLKE